MNAPIQVIALAKLVYSIPLSGNLVLFKVGLNKHEVKILTVCLPSIRNFYWFKLQCGLKENLLSVEQSYICYKSKFCLYDLIISYASSIVTIVPPRSII